jgi:hypothetical protein
VENIYENIFHKLFSRSSLFVILHVSRIDHRITNDLQVKQMNHQEHFPTIWDTPRKPSAKTASQPPAKKALSPVKEVFLSIWDTPKRPTNA